MTAAFIELNDNLSITKNKNRTFANYKRKHCGYINIGRSCIDTNIDFVELNKHNRDT